MRNRALPEVASGVPKMTQGYLRTPEAAKYLGVSKSLLDKGRISGTGPRFCTLGDRIVTYAIADLDAWASRSVAFSTSEREAA
jgi:predicted DNA-binding transcriptional regulator AlpA